VSVFGSVPAAMDQKSEEGGGRLWFQPVCPFSALSFLFCGEVEVRLTSSLLSLLVEDGSAPPRNFVVLAKEEDGDRRFVPFHGLFARFVVVVAVMLCHLVDDRILLDNVDVDDDDDVDDGAVVVVVIT